jgi:polar amino acid transport system substrate-binding protein
MKPRSAAVFLFAFFLRHLYTESMKKLLFSLLVLCLSQFAFSQTSNVNKTVGPILITSFAPTGTLRVGINLGNPILANENPSTHEPQGISVDIAREIGKRLGVPVELVPFKSAGNTVDAIKTGNIDMVFVAIDPVRGADISYTPPYIQIEGAYMVKANSPITANEQVDVAGNEIVVGKGSAYDLFLTREIKNATIFRAINSQAVIDDFMNGKGNVAAGVRQQLESDAKRYEGLRMLPGRFMAINQAIGIPKARPQYENTTAYLSQVITQLKQSGFIAQAMQRHHIEGAKVAE